MPNLLISKYNLDEECVQQPELYRQAAEYSALCVQERDQAELDMDIVYAEIAKEIRQRAMDRNERITEKAIESMIYLNSTYLQAKTKFLELKVKAIKADANRRAWEQRKDTLEYLCRLFLAGYFSEVSVAQNTSAATNVSRRVREQQLEETIERGRE